MVTDTGTSYVGYWKGGLQPNTQIIDQILWSGIGYGVGAVQGAALATVELAKGRRTICFEGDGKCLEFTHERRCSGNYYNLNVTMFVIENDGYTIVDCLLRLITLHADSAGLERFVQRYRWKYTKFPWVCTLEEHHDRIKTWRIRTRQGLERLLCSPEFAQGVCSL